MIFKKSVGVTFVDNFNGHKPADSKPKISDVKITYIGAGDPFQPV